MTDSTQSYNIKNIIFIVAIATLSVLFVISMVFLVLAIKKEREQEKSKQTKAVEGTETKKTKSVEGTETKKKVVMTTEDAKKKKYDIKTEINEFRSEVMINLKNKNEIKELSNCFVKELQAIIKQGNFSGIVLIQFVNDFYVKHKQELESVLEIILLCVRDFFQKKDPKLFKYIGKYFAGVFKELKPNFEKELISINELCTSKKQSSYILMPNVSFNNFISELNNAIENFISNPLLIEVYQKILNKETINQEERREYNVYVMQFYNLFSILYINFKDLFETKMNGANFENNEDHKNIIKNLEEQKEKIYRISNSGNFELFDQEITKEIFKNFMFYVILMNLNLELSKNIYPGFFFTQDRQMLQVLDALDLRHSGILLIEILDDIFGILERIIENQIYDAKKDVEVIRNFFIKIVTNKKLCGSIINLLLSIVEEEEVTPEPRIPMEEVRIPIRNPRFSSIFENPKSNPEEPETQTEASPTTSTRREPETQTGVMGSLPTGEEPIASSEEWPALPVSAGSATSTGSESPRYPSVIGSSITRSEPIRSTSETPPTYASVLRSRPTGSGLVTPTGSR